MITETSYQNLPAFELSDEHTRLTIVPAFGGSIAELFDIERKHEWLYKNPNLSYQVPDYGDDFDQFDVGGLFDCFPTIEPCFYPSGPWRGTPLPNHGEVWALPWEAEIEEADQSENEDEDQDQAESEDEKTAKILHLSTHGMRLPYRLEKRIHIQENGRIHFDYHATNLSHEPLPFLWSLHPLLNVSPGMEISIPVEQMQVVSAPSFPANFADVIPWPFYEGMDLERVPEPDAGIAVKLLSRELPVGWVELSDPDTKAAIRFEFDPTVLTHLGLWLNYGGWPGNADPEAEPLFNIAIEPGIGAPDSLVTAVNHWGQYGVLPPKNSRHWWFQISIS